MAHCFVRQLTLAMLCAVVLMHDPHSVASGQESWQIVSANGKFVAAYVSPLDVEAQVAAIKLDNPGMTDIELDRERKRLSAIVSQYPSTGVYQSGSFSAPLWTFPNHGPYGYLSSDGSRLAVPGSVVDPLADELEAVVYGPNGFERRLADYEILSWPLITAMHYLRGIDVYVDQVVLDQSGTMLVCTSTLGDVYNVSLADLQVQNASLTSGSVLTLAVLYGGVLLVASALIALSIYAVRSLMSRRRR